MNKEERQNNGNKKLAKTIDDFADEKLNKKNSEDEDTISQENFENLNQNRKNLNKLYEIKATENLSFKETAPTTKSKGKSHTKNKHNLRKKTTKTKFKSLKKNIKTFLSKK